MLLFVRHAVIIIALLIGTVTDLKKREVPDWLNFSLIGSGILFGILESIFAWSWQPFIWMALGLFVGVCIGYIMFYAGQWGGGDAKMIMGLGALFGVSLSQWSFFNPPLFFIFLVNTLLVGAVYGLFWLFFLALRKRKVFFKEFKTFIHSKKIMRLRIVVVVATLFSWMLALLVPDQAFKIIFAGLGILIFGLFYLWIIIKMVEKVAMLKTLSVSKLVEGDWINNDVWVKQSYSSFFALAKKRSLAEFSFMVNYDSLLAFYKQLSWKNAAKKREEKIKRKYVLSDAVLAKKVLSSYLATCKKKVVLSLSDLTNALSASKNDLLKLDNVLTKKSCPSLLDHLKKNFFYAPDEEYITGPKELGVRRDQIALLNKYEIKTVLVKEGVPFVPSFLLAYVLTILLQNWFLLLI